MVGAGEEEAVTDWEVGKAFLLFTGELENIGQNINGGSGLLEEELHGRVGNDGATHFTAHEVFHILSNSGETKIILTGALSKAEEEVGGIVVFHELPGLINNEKAAFLLSTNDVPDVRKNNIHSDRAKLIFEVADIKDNHLIIDVDVALLGENTSEGTSGVFAKTLSELWSSATHV